MTFSSQAIASGHRLFVEVWIKSRLQNFLIVDPNTVLFTPSANIHSFFWSAHQEKCGARTLLFRQVNPFGQCVVLDVFDPKPKEAVTQRDDVKPTCLDSFWEIRNGHH